MEKLYAAYGTLMAEEPMKAICPTAEMVGTGVIRNYRLMFKGELPLSRATVEDDKGSEVPIVVWRLTEANVSDLGAELTRWGSYHEAEIKAVVGKRVVPVTVHVKDDGERLNPPDSHYYAAIYAVYEEHGFDLEKLEEALEYSERRFGWI